MLIATAGHVDHGKTSLVRALTGVNTDRLAEEARRGLTIELGFAYQTFSEGHTLGFIDVPGHQRFMNTMISGITGIDLGLLIVAADDGPMPQTLEHLQILRLLGVKDYLVVITKMDLVDNRRIEEVKIQIEALLPRTEILTVSTKINQGIEALSRVLKSKAKKKKTRLAYGNFRLYVDRVFTKKGAGLIVTGTVLSGKVKLSDELYWHSSSASDMRKVVRVRAVHTQGREATHGRAGERCALNLTGKLSLREIQRGDVLIASADTLPAKRLDARVWSPEGAGRELKHMGRVKLYIGSRRMNARTYLTSKDDKDGQIVQLIIEGNGVISFAGDPIIIRDHSERHILVGGRIIDPIAKKWTKYRAEKRVWIYALDAPDAVQSLAHLVIDQGEAISLNRHKRIWNLTEKEAQDILLLEPFVNNRIVTLAKNSDHYIVSSLQWETYKSNLVHALTDWYKLNPQGMSLAIDELQGITASTIPSLIFPDVLRAKVRSGDITQNENQVSLFARKPVLKLGTHRDWAQLEKLMHGRFPLRSEIEKELGFDTRKIEALTRKKIKNRDIFEIGEKRLGLPATLFAFAQMIAELSKSGPFTIIDAKKTFNLGRGQTIEILEFFDKIKFTTRTENSRCITTLDIALRVLKR